MLQRGLLNLLILPIIVKFSTSQYPPCSICGTGYGIANPANYVAFQDGTYKTCSTVESEALYGYYTEAYCKQYQPSFQQMCGCEATEATEAPPTSPQQPPTAPATAPQQPPTAPVTGPQQPSTAPATAPQQPHSAPTTTSPPSTSNVGAIVGYVVAGLFGVGLGAGLFNFYNTGTCNIFNFNFNKYERAVDADPVSKAAHRKPNQEAASVTSSIVLSESMNSTKCTSYSIYESVSM